MGDIIESQAIESVYGNKPFVTGLKSYTGHTMGTCGVIELIMTLYMMEVGFIAPTLNLEEVDHRCAGLRHTPELLDKNQRRLQYRISPLEASIPACWSEMPREGVFD